ncbi:hypothetical protein HK101_005314, partial [Irineochytrium annulatum]
MTTNAAPSEWSTSSLARQPSSTAHAAVSDDADISYPIAAAAEDVDDDSVLLRDRPTAARPLAPYTIDADTLRSSSRGRVSVRVVMDRGLFLVGQVATGRLEVICHRDRNLKLGEIAVHAVGFEEVIQPKSAPQRRVFFSRTLQLQCARLAPSDAVHPGPHDEHEMWAAKKGITSFPFRIKLDGLEEQGSKQGATMGRAAAPMPSSFWNKKAGG